MQPNVNGIYSVSFVYQLIQNVVLQFSFIDLNVFFLIVGNRSPLAQMEEERREHVAKMKKMEMEMEQVFEMKVKEKVQKLKDSEAEVISFINRLSVFLLNSMLIEM